MDFKGDVEHRLGQIRGPTLSFSASPAGTTFATQPPLIDSLQSFRTVPLPSLPDAVFKPLLRCGVRR